MDAVRCGAPLRLSQAHAMVQEEDEASEFIEGILTESAPSPAASNVPVPVVAPAKEGIPLQRNQRKKSRLHFIFIYSLPPLEMS